MRRLALLLLVLVGCKHEEQVGTISGPPLLIDRSDSAAPSASSAPVEAGVVPPPRADFSDVDAKDGFRWEETVDCEQSIFVAVKGTIIVTGAVHETLGVGDAITLQGKGAYEVRGPGTVVRANVSVPTCEGPRVGETKSKVFRANAVAPLTWAGGKMHASLLVEKDDAKFAYVGLLGGVSAVAEHVHDTSWEILCAIDAAGDFTVAGVTARLGPRKCVTIPPNTKHSWSPDAGRALSAVQFYVPAGPEQRFRGLAAAEK